MADELRSVREVAVWTNGQWQKPDRWSGTLSSRIEKKSLSETELRRSEREGIQSESTLQMDSAFCCTASSWRAERTDKPTKEEHIFNDHLPYLRGSFWDVTTSQIHRLLSVFWHVKLDGWGTIAHSVVGSAVLDQRRRRRCLGPKRGLVYVRRTPAANACLWAKRQNYWFSREKGKVAFPR